MFQFRSFVFRYAHHNPDQHHAIQSGLETLIQSELKSSMHENQQAPDAPPSTPQSHASPDVLNDFSPLCSTDRRGKDRNKSIGQWSGTRGRPSSIIVQDTVMPLSSVGAGEDAQVQRISKSAKAGAIHRTSPAASERNLPTCTTDHAPIDKSLQGHVGHRGKKRKARFGRGCRTQTSREGPYHTSFETKRNLYVCAASRVR